MNNDGWLLQRKGASQIPMKLGWRIIWSVGSLLLALFLVATLLMVFERWHSQPAYDVEHPDHAHFAARFAAAQKALDAGESAVIDLAPLNGGAWQTACLFGGYSDPVRHMSNLGAIVTSEDELRFKGSVARVTPVEEFEAAIGFTDEAGTAHFVHFGSGLGASGQHYQACVTRPDTKVSIQG